MWPDENGLKRSQFLTYLEALSMKNSAWLFQHGPWTPANCQKVKSQVQQQGLLEWMPSAIPDRFPVLSEFNFAHINVYHPWISHPFQFGTLMGLNHEFHVSSAMVLKEHSFSTPLISIPDEKKIMLQLKRIGLSSKLVKHTLSLWGAAVTMAGIAVARWLSQCW